jgi:hypothetical protein
VLLAALVAAALAEMALVDKGLELRALQIQAAAVVAVRIQAGITLVAQAAPALSSCPCQQPITPAPQPAPLQ